MKNLYSAAVFLTLLTACVECGRADEATVSFLKRHCIDCHQGDEAEGGLDLITLSRDLNDPAAFDRWVRVVDRVAAKEMPPPDAAQPSASRQQTFVDTTADWLNNHQRTTFQTVGRVQGRRLTNLQLERTLHDLLGIDIPLATMMPEEPRTDGFTSVADGQSISHFHLQTHLNVIDAALDEALRRAMKDKPDEWSKTLSAEQVARDNPRRRCREPEMLDGKAVVWRAGVIFYGRLPVTTAREAGWHRLTIRASALNAPKDRGVWCTVRTGKCVSSAPLLDWAGAFEATDDPAEWTFEAWLPEGHMFEVRPADATVRSGSFSGGQVGAGEGTSQNVSGLAIHEVQLERFHQGPDNKQIRRQLLEGLSLEWDKSAKQMRVVSNDPKPQMERLLRRFAERAFRRPIADDVVRPYIDLAHADLDAGASLLDAIRGGYRAILCSPRFLYFQEAPGPLDDYALASRLSYFLWNSMPDQTLRQAAAEGRLRQPDVLNAQVERMLRHPRGADFVKDLAHQWLDLHLIDFTEPDRRMFPDFDVIVQQSMLEETHAYLQAMLDENLSVSHLINADFTFLNSRLARHYKIDNVDGDELRKVSLRPDDHRGGLLTQGSILKVTANGTNTSPVIRGVWVSERLLGTDIPPPPKNVPAIEPDIRGAKTIRDMLARHKADAACASCHVKIDPPGFALENFDPAGQWRDSYRTFDKGKKARKLPIDASFELPDGRPFANVEEFKKLVLHDKSALAANVARQLITYGTGAVCEFSDRSGVDQIVQKCEDADYGFRSLVKHVVTSEIFCTK
ncbi:MAG: DUF1592 domain-containing protein [Planctomycetaceae bacterium]